MTQVYDQIWSNITKCEEIYGQNVQRKYKKSAKKLDWKLSPIGIDPFWRVQMSLSWKPHILCWVVFHEVPILRHIFHMSSSYRPHIVSIGVPYCAVHNVHPSGPHIVPNLSSCRPNSGPISNLVFVLLLLKCVANVLKGKVRENHVVPPSAFNKIIHGHLGGKMSVRTNLLTGWKKPPCFLQCPDLIDNFLWKVVPE